MQGWWCGAHSKAVAAAATAAAACFCFKKSRPSQELGFPFACHLISNNVFFVGGGDSGCEALISQPPTLMNLLYQASAQQPPRCLSGWVVGVSTWGGGHTSFKTLNCTHHLSPNIWSISCQWFFFSSHPSLNVRLNSPFLKIVKMENVISGWACRLIKGRDL